MRAAVVSKSVFPCPGREALARLARRADGRTAHRCHGEGGIADGLGSSRHGVTQRRRGELGNTLTETDRGGESE